MKCEHCNHGKTDKEIMEDEKKARTGQKLADILKLRKDQKNKGRYSTTWGSKTPLGLYETVIAILKEHQKG